jgi:hypothetical protein
MAVIAAAALIICCTVVAIGCYCIRRLASLQVMLKLVNYLMWLYNIKERAKEKLTFHVFDAR